MSNFKTWYNEIADMPELVNGRWVDLETGIPFSAEIAPVAKKARTAPALVINGKPAKIAEGLIYAARLLSGQKAAVAKFAAFPQSDTRDAYLIAAEAAISAINELSEKSKKAAIAQAIKLNQHASRAQNAIPR
jgi:hypothetical protein